jgi:hypothetical protein
MPWPNLFGFRAGGTEQRESGAASDGGPLLGAGSRRRESLAVPSGLPGGAAHGGGSDSEQDMAQRRIRKNPM